MARNRQKPSRQVQIGFKGLRHNISLRRRTNKKKDSADFGRAKIQEFHQNLRKTVQSK